MDFAVWWGRVRDSRLSVHRLLLKGTDIPLSVVVLGGAELGSSLAGIWRRVKTKGQSAAGVSLWGRRWLWQMRGRHSHRGEWTEQKWRIQGGRERELFVTSCRVKIGKVVWVGYQERQELRPGSEAVEAAAAVRACTAQHWEGAQQCQDCWAGRLGASLPFLAFPLKQMVSILREIISHFPGAAAPGCHWSVGHTQTLISVRFPRVPSVTFHVGCPGANPWDCSCRPDSIPGHSRAGLSWWCDCTSGDHNELAVFQWLLKSLD